MPDPVPLSVVVITRNESARLADCLTSVQWAGEIVVVDDESTDATRQIALRFTDRIFTRRMEVEGRHRNWAYAQARFPWVFSLDADERVTPELAKEIQELLRGDPTSDVYAVPRRNFIGKTWIRFGGWYPSQQVKLFKKGVLQWEETTVHPRALTTSNKPWGQLKSDLIHYSYRDLGDFLKKMNRQTTLEAQKWVLDKRTIGLGKALWRSMDRFLRSWWFKRGYRDQFLGFAVAIFSGMYQFLSYAKYWLRTAKASPLLTPRPKAKPWRAQERSKDEPKGGLEKPVAGRQRLSVVILTYQAAQAIGRCLDSVLWADEVIVVDNGSTDQTQEICRRAGARVVVDETRDNFAQLRNRGTDAAQGDWILQLDADEVVTPEFRQTLQEILLGRGDPEFSAYRFRRKNYFIGHRMRWGGWDHLSLQLFRKGKARYEGRVHERLAVEGSIGVLPVGVEHYPFCSLEEFIDRQNRYTDLQAQELLENQGRPSLKTIWRKATMRPLKIFWKVWVKKQGFREGPIGFFFAVLFAFVDFLIWVKVWEKAYGDA